MGGERRIEPDTKPESKDSSDALADYRIPRLEKTADFGERFVSCSLENLKLGDISLFTGNERLPSSDGTISTDENGRLSVYKNCSAVFSYGPNSGDIFKWIPQNGQTILSEIAHADGRIHRFNALGNEWLVFDAQGRLEDKQKSHLASCSVKGVSVDIPISGAVSVEKLRAEYEKFRAVIAGDDIPFGKEDM